MYPALVIASTFLVLRILICYFQYIRSLKSPRQAFLEDSLESLKAARAQMTDFVSKSKNERECIKLEKELNFLMGKQKAYSADGKVIQPQTQGPDYATLLSNYAQPALTVGFVYVYWSTPMVLVTKLSLWPLGWFYLSYGGTAIGVIMWLTACNSVACRVVPWVFQALGCAPPAAEKSILDTVWGFFKSFL